MLSWWHYPYYPPKVQVGEIRSVNKLYSKIPCWVKCVYYYVYYHGPKMTMKMHFSFFQIVLRFYSCLNAVETTHKLLIRTSFASLTLITILLLRLFIEIQLLVFQWNSLKDCLAEFFFWLNFFILIIFCIQLFAF